MFLLQRALTSQSVFIDKEPLPLVLIQGDQERYFTRPDDTWLLSTVEISCPEQTGTALLFLAPPRMS